MYNNILAHIDKLNKDNSVNRYITINKRTKIAANASTLALRNQNTRLPISFARSGQTDEGLLPVSLVLQTTLVKRQETAPQDHEAGAESGRIEFRC
jgi:hypothetical protein